MAAATRRRAFVFLAWFIFFVGITVGVGFYIFHSFSSSFDNIINESSGCPKTGTDQSWIPAGYQDAGCGVAIRWMKQKELKHADCILRCFGVMASPNQRCDTLYIEIAVLDRNSVNLGFSNDMAMGVNALARAKLTFEVTENSGSRAEISDIKCL